MKKQLLVLGFGLISMLTKAQFLNDGNYKYSDTPEGGAIFMEFTVTSNNLLVSSFNLSDGPDEYANKAKGKWVASQTKNEVLEKKKANGKYQIIGGKTTYKIEYVSDKTIKLYGIGKDAFILYKQK